MGAGVAGVISRYAKIGVFYALFVCSVFDCTPTRETALFWEAD